MHVRLLRRTLASALGGSLLLSVPALGSAQANSPRDPSGAKVCPMDVPRTQVLERGFDGGAVLIFVTRGPLEALRGRVKALAALHNAEEARGDAALDAQASVQEIEHGAVLRFDFAD